MTEAHLDVRGVRVRLLRSGDGPPLLSLHGSGDRGDWLPVLTELAASCDVVRPDLPGFGGSDEDERIDSVHDLAFFTLDLLDELGIERTTVVGFSLGGWLAVELATIEPRRVEKLVLVGAAGLRVEGCEQPDVFTLDPVRLVELAYHDPARRERAVAAARALDDDPEALQLYLRSRVATAHLAWNPYFHDPKLVHRLHRVTAPTLVVWGREDGLLPVAHGHRWQELLPHARLEVLDESGHLPHVERPAEFLEVVRPFLEGVPAGV